MPDDTTNVLLVDDLPEKVLVYRSILEELGQNLVVARSGEEALGQLLRSDFAVILLDVNMPGMNGFETAAMIRKRKKSAHIPIIFLTAFADEVHAAEGYAHGAVDYIPTPVVPAILRAKVRVFVDLYRMTQQVRRQADERIALAEERSKRAAAEEAARRVGFLAEVSRALADSLDPDTTARTVARQAVPLLADLAGVTLAPDAPGQPGRASIAWDAGRGEVRTHHFEASDARDDRLRDAVERVLRSGAAESVSGLDVPYPPSGAEAGRVRSASVLPLRARGRTLGALTLALGPSGRRHEPADVALAEDLARRAAVALDNARLYRDVENANRQKNEFLSMLAHELRNPLAPIRNAAQVLRLRGSDPAVVKWSREVIDRQLNHLVRLVDDLLDVSRITQGKIRLQVAPADLRDAVSQAVEAARPLVDRLKHQLDVAPMPEPIPVHGDRDRLTQVVTNLLNNAAKYTEEGGRVWLSAAAEGGDAVVRVRDTGVGIPAEMLATVFELFAQANRSIDRAQGGLGVGLTLVRRLVEMHGGSVGAASEGAGKGSEFTVRIPLAKGAGGAGAADDSEAGGDPPRRVLLVDDNADAVDSLAELLRMIGHEVRVAYDGPSGIELVRASRPDVVLLDIGLPGMDGYEVARRLRELPEASGALLVAASGYGRDDDRRRSREAGFAQHLVKPVDLAALRALLRAGGVR